MVFRGNRVDTQARRAIDNGRKTGKIRGPALTSGPAFIRFEKSECETSLPARFEKAVAANEDRVAVSFQGREMAYGKLNASANRIAHALAAAGAAVGDPVVLFMPNNPGALAAYIGALKAGCTAVPLDPAHPAERNRTILHESGAGILLADTASISLARSMAAGATEIIDVDALPAALATGNPGVSVDARSIAALYFTSGSTGTPKGVALSHRLMLHTTMNFTNTLRVNRNDRIALTLSLAFGGAQELLFGPLLNGAAACMLDFTRAGIPGLASWLENEEITLFYTVPSVFRRLAEHLHGAPVLPALRILRLAGEPILASDAALYRRLLGDHCVLADAYGATESGLDTQCFIGAQTEVTTATVPIGYPCEDVEMLILDEEGGQVPPGGVGQIAVMSEYLADGYWRREDLTCAKFLPDPSGGPKRIYLTGDLGRVLDDGRLLHMGRVDFQAKIRAQRVELGEVEAALSVLDYVKESVAVVREDAPGDARLVAYVVPNNSKPPSVARLRDDLAENLPDYMLPSRFVILDALPVNAMGKIDRRALPPPGNARPVLENEYAPPRTPIEKALVRIWAAVLGIEGIGIDDNFFNLGGHSLQAAQAMARIADEFSADLKPQLLFETPTISGLAASLTAHLAQRADPDDLEELLRK